MRLVAAGLLASSLLLVPTAAAQPSTAPTLPTTSPCPTPAPGYVERAPGRGLTVALTFDDGPSTYTPQVLKVLRTYGVRATFFETGLHDSQHRRWARQVAREGHLIGNHTWHHRTPAEVEGGWTAAYLRDELGSTDRLQRKLTGRPTCFMRPPGGHRSPALLPTAHALGLTVVMWTAGTDDWAGPPRSSRAWVRTIVHNAAAGLQQRHPIVLLHDGKASHEPEDVVSSYRGNTVAALPRIIRLYQRAGYTFVGMDGGSGLPAPTPPPTPAPGSVPVP